MQHKVKVTYKPETESLVQCREVNMRERLFRKLLGKKQRLTVIIPGDTVKSIAIQEK